MEDKTTYQNADRRLASRILSEDRSATRVELEILFQRHFVGRTLSSHLLQLIRDDELKRLVGLELYRVNVYDLEKDKGCVLAQVSQLVGVHSQTFYKWLRRNDLQEGKN